MIDKLLHRRSIRIFKPDPIPEDVLHQILTLAVHAPSSRNQKPWRFKVVVEHAVLSQLAQCKQTGSEFLKRAPAAIIVMGNPLVSDVWIEDCAIASYQIQLAALSVGLGSCWIQIRNREKASGENSDHFIRDLLNLPTELEILSIIALGYPAEQFPDRSKTDYTPFLL